MGACSSVQANYLITKAEELASDGYIYSSVQQLHEAIRICPHSLQAHLSLAASYAQANQPHNSIDRLELVREDAEARGEHEFEWLACLQLVDLWMKEGREPWMSLQGTLSGNQRALECAERAVQLKPIAQSYAFLAAALYDLEQVERAEEMAIKSLEYSKKERGICVEACLIRARIAIDRGEFPVADLYLQMIEGDRDKRWEIDCLRGTAYLAQHHYDLAASTFRTCLSLHPGCMFAAIQLAACLLEQGQSSEACQLYESCRGRLHKYTQSLSARDSAALLLIGTKIENYYVTGIYEHPGAVEPSVSHTPDMTRSKNAALSARATPRMHNGAGSAAAAAAAGTAAASNGSGGSINGNNSNGNGNLSVPTTPLAHGRSAPDAHYARDVDDNPLDGFHSDASLSISGGGSVGGGLDASLVSPNGGVYVTSAVGSGGGGGGGNGGGIFDSLHATTTFTSSIQYQHGYMGGGGGGGPGNGTGISDAFQSTTVVTSITADASINDTFQVL